MQFVNGFPKHARIAQIWARFAQMLQRALREMQFANGFPKQARFAKIWGRFA